MGCDARGHQQRAGPDGTHRAEALLGQIDHRTVRQIPREPSQAIALEAPSAVSATTKERERRSRPGWTAANGALTGINEAVARVRELARAGRQRDRSQGNLESIASEVEQLTQVAQAGRRHAVRRVSTSSLEPRPARLLPTGGKRLLQRQQRLHRPERRALDDVAVTVSINSLLGEGKAANDGKLLDTLRTIATNLREGTPAAREALNSKDLGALETNISTLDSLQATVGANTDQIAAAVSRIET